MADSESKLCECESPDIHAGTPSRCRRCRRLTSYPKSSVSLPKPQGGSANCNDPDPTNVKPFSLPTLSIIIGGQPPSRNPYKYSPWFFAEYFRGDKYSRRSLTLILPFFELRIY